MIANAKMRLMLGANRHAWLLAGYLCVVFLIGGGARGDLASLPLLRPLAIILLGVSLYGLSKAQYRALRSIFVLGGLCLALAALHLVPLPPALWMHLPGRDLAVEVADVAGMTSDWRAISLVPDGALNALYSLFVPLAALGLLARCSVEQRRGMLVVVIAIGAIDAVLTVFQVVGPPDSPLYFYRITNVGGAVGLFANRNHNAIFLATLFPLLAGYAYGKAADRRGVSLRFEELRPLVLAIGSLAIIPLLLVAGSRGGAVLGLASLLLVPLVVIGASGTDAVARHWRGLAIVTMVALVAVMTFLFSRAAAVQRLIETGGSAETRLIVWGPIADMTIKYMPFGSGIGSFVEVFQVDEPLAALDTTYLNHAHNDFLEVALTAGVPGLLLIVFTAAILLRAAWCLWVRMPRVDHGVLVGRAGVATAFLLALGSVADYPLRVPSLACLFVVAMSWMVDGVRRGGAAGPEAAERSNSRSELSGTRG